MYFEVKINVTQPQYMNLQKYSQKILVNINILPTCNFLEFKSVSPTDLCIEWIAHLTTKAEACRKALLPVRSVLKHHTSQNTSEHESELE